MPNNVIQLPYTSAQIQDFMSRFMDYDLEWIHKEKSLNFEPVSSGTINVDLSSYLPNDGYMYEIMFEWYAPSGNSSNIRAYSETPIGEKYFSGGVHSGASGTFGRTMNYACVANRSLELEAYTNTPLVQIIFHAYRRAGKLQTNS